jgi:DNA-binding CsgD family transcriptional regulator
MKLPELRAHENLLLSALSQGYSLGDIAGILNMSVWGIEGVEQDVFQKLEVKNRGDAIKWWRNYAAKREAA